MNRKQAYEQIFEISYNIVKATHFYSEGEASPGRRRTETIAAQRVDDHRDPLVLARFQGALASITNVERGEGQFECLDS